MIMTKNGITINTELEPDNRSFFSIGDRDHSYHVNINEKAGLLLKQFLSDSEPVEDNRKWHYETLHWIEDRRNSRWFCRKCKIQTATVFNACEVCGSELVDVFNYENKIYG